MKYVSNWVEDHLAKLFGKDTLVSRIFSETLEGIQQYEEEYGKEELQKALATGGKAYSDALAAGLTKAPALVKAVVAFFESEAQSIKTVATEDAMAALAGYVK